MPIKYCRAIKKDGTPCRQPVGPTRDICTPHSQGDERAAYQRKAIDASLKQRNGLGPEFVDPDLTTQSKRNKFRSRIAGFVGRGELSDKLASVMLRAADGVAQEEPRVAPVIPGITVNVLVVSADGSRKVIATAPAQPQFPSRISAGDDA
jgi:hypothetical protein